MRIDGITETQINNTITSTSPVVETTEVGVTPSTEVTDTPTGEVTPSTEVTDTPTGEVTPSTEVTDTPTETATATEVVPTEEMRIFVEDKVEFGGHEMDFTISMDKSDKIVQDAFDYFGFENISINEKKENARELIAKTLAYSLKDTYNYQNGANITLEEYVANPEKYPAKIMARDGEGKLVEQTITYDQIKELEFRYTSGLDGELFYSYPGIFDSSVGYGFENGKLIYFLPLSKGNRDINFSMSKGGIYLRNLGFTFIQGNFGRMSYMMPYSIEKVRDGIKDEKVIDARGEMESIYTQLQKLLWESYSNMDERQEYIAENELFDVYLK
jgi:hypothetical protein